MNLINVLGVATDRKISQKGQKDRGVYIYDDERCLRWSLSVAVPLRGSKLRAASRREVRALPTLWLYNFG
ncbi:MAG: hypothetical protein V7K77_21390 [Nostoc sp.]|uniref:hypothetical protein n=1 Tax=Nostoc sp. TaxID=1180 RepID=UPI002FFCAE47